MSKLRHVSNEFHDIDLNNHSLQASQCQVLKVLLQNLLAFSKRIHPSKPVTYSSTGKTTSNAQANFNIYVGGGGYLYLYLKLYMFFKNNQALINQLANGTGFQKEVVAEISNPG